MQELQLPARLLDSAVRVACYVEGGHVARDGIAALSQREREVLGLLARGHDAKSVAEALDLSVHTVNDHLRAARRKLGAPSSRAAARVLAAEHPHFVGMADFGIGGDVGLEPGTGPARLGEPSGLVPVGHWKGPLMIATVLLLAGGLLARSSGRAPTPPAAPHVVATVPASGAVVPAGPMTLQVTFDRPMRPGNYSFVRKDVDTYPDCGDNRPVQSADGRTFSLHCTLLPGRTYEIWFNSEPYMNFKSLDGVPAVPHGLTFRTR